MKFLDNPIFCLRRDRTIFKNISEPVPLRSELRTTAEMKDEYMESFTEAA